MINLNQLQDAKYVQELVSAAEQGIGQLFNRWPALKSSYLDDKRLGKLDQIQLTKIKR